MVGRCCGAECSQLGLTNAKPGYILGFVKDTTTTDKTYVIAMSRPVKFPGTRGEAAANFKTHSWLWDDDDTRCFNCDSRPSYEAANYPCGADVPRETVKVSL